MYILCFDVSKSKNFPKALQIAQNLGATFDGNTVTLTISEWNKISNLYELLLPLIGIIHSWSSTRASFNGKSVHPFGFMMSTRVLKECNANYTKSDQNYCWGSNPQFKNWGCKLLSTIMLYPAKDANYKSNDKYWYNFGKFINEDTWEINKILIIEKIINSAKDTGVSLCPYFDIMRIHEIVDILPDYIKVDNINWEFFYSSKFVGIKQERIPINIRHIPILTDDEKILKNIRERIKQLEYTIGMGLMSQEDEKRAKEQLLILKKKYSQPGHLVVPIASISLRNEIEPPPKDDLSKIDEFLDQLLEQRKKKDCKGRED